ncbi:MAG TPA: hypothetical protein VGN17_29095 [Bryobacteraceae bacterium]|jgi:hypothetical protein
MRPLKLIASIALATTLIQPGMAVDTDDSNDPIITKFLDASKRQQQALLGSQMEVDIDANIPKLKEHGNMKFLRTVRTVPKLGQIFYRKLGEFVGDKTVQHQVIERYVELEEDGGPGKDSIAITPANYKFRLKSKMTINQQQTYVFELTPKGKKRDGLFKGELWLDAATGMPLKERGKLVKNPSTLFLKSVEFVNDFSLQDGIAIPAHVECTIETRIAGKAELSINFSNFSRAVPEEEASVIPVSNP